MYLNSIPYNAIFQYHNEKNKNPFTTVYARDGHILGLVLHTDCSLPEAEGQVYNPKTRIWTVKLKNGKFIDGLSSHLQFRHLPIMPIQ